MEGEKGAALTAGALGIDAHRQSIVGDAVGGLLDGGHRVAGVLAVDGHKAEAAYQRPNDRDLKYAGLGNKHHIAPQHRQGAQGIKGGEMVAYQQKGDVGQLVRAVDTDAIAYGAQRPP